MTSRRDMEAWLIDVAIRARLTVLNDEVMAQE
jgi:hypothetical protein